MRELHQLVRVTVDVSVDEIVQKLGEEPALVGRAMAAAIRVRARAMRRINS